MRVWVVACLLCFSIVSIADESQQWKHISGNIWSGVKIYMGEGADKGFVGTVLGGNDNYVHPSTGATFRGLKMEMSSGRSEWKNRDDFIMNDYLFVKKDDPALTRYEWFEYAN